VPAHFENPVWNKRSKIVKGANGDDKESRRQMRGTLSREGIKELIQNTGRPCTTSTFPLGVKGSENKKISLSLFSFSRSLLVGSSRHDHHFTRLLLKIVIEARRVSCGLDERSHNRNWTAPHATREGMLERAKDGGRKGGGEGRREGSAEG